MPNLSSTPSIQSALSTIAYTMLSGVACSVQSKRCLGSPCISQSCLHHLYGSSISASYYSTHVCNQ